MKSYETQDFNWQFPDSEHHFQTILAINPEYQFKVKNMASRHQSKIDFTTALDIGANVGLWTRWLSRQGAREVHCFEPMPYNLECLRLNVSDLANVTIHPHALSNSEGEINLYTTESNSNTGTATIMQDNSFNVEHRVNCKRLDDLNLSPTFIKIDVQGAELLVFEGGVETIKRCMPAIITECETEQCDSVQFLIDLGYYQAERSSSDFLMLPR